MARIIGLFFLVAFAVFGMVIAFPATNYLLFVAWGFPVTLPMIGFLGTYGALIKVTG